MQLGGAWRTGAAILNRRPSPHPHPGRWQHMPSPEHAWWAGCPRSFWVYSDEAKNFHLKRLFSVCSKGTSVNQQILLRLEWRFALEGLLGGQRAR